MDTPSNKLQFLMSCPLDAATRDERRALVMAPEQRTDEIRRVLSKFQAERENVSIPPGPMVALPWARGATAARASGSALAVPRRAAEATPGLGHLSLQERVHIFHRANGFEPSSVELENFTSTVGLGPQLAVDSNLRPQSHCHSSAPLIGATERAVHEMLARGHATTQVQLLAATARGPSSTRDHAALEPLSNTLPGAAELSALRAALANHASSKAEEMRLRESHLRRAMDQAQQVAATTLRRRALIEAEREQLTREAATNMRIQTLVAGYEELRNREFDRSVAEAVAWAGLRRGLEGAELRRAELWALSQEGPTASAIGAGPHRRAFSARI